MDSTIREQLPIILGVLFLLVAATGVWAVNLQRQLRDYTKVWSRFLSQADGADVEAMVRDQLRLLSEQQETIRGLEDRIKVLEAKMLQSKRFVGVVRFNAFDAVGGDQSFSLAVYDDDGNGFVVTSQIGRESSRVYGKQLIAGRCDQILSAEEQQAIEQASHSKGKVRIG